MLLSPQVRVIQKRSNTPCAKIPRNIFRYPHFPRAVRKHEGLNLKTVLGRRAEQTCFCNVTPKSTETAPPCEKRTKVLSFVLLASPAKSATLRSTQAASLVSKLAPPRLDLAASASDAASAGSLGQHEQLSGAAAARPRRPQAKGLDSGLEMRSGAPAAAIRVGSRWCRLVAPQSSAGIRAAARRHRRASSENPPPRTSQGQPSCRRTRCVSTGWGRRSRRPPIRAPRQRLGAPPPSG